MRRLAVLASIAALAALILLERERAGLSVTRLVVAGAPVTLWRPEGDGVRPLVVVAHGYAGSRQMMRAFAVTLARSGLDVAVLDLPGHGRHPRPMTGDVTRLDGATATLVAQVEAVARALSPTEGLALLGHSMATDVVVRAAETLGPEAVVAVSMYSEAVTSETPARLLILSGAQERRLRGVALEAVRRIDPAAEEGETVGEGPILRRAVSVPWVGHVGVLYAPAGLREARDWIVGALGMSGRGEPPATALWLGLLLGALLVLARPLAAAFGPPRPVPPPVRRRTAWLAVLAPLPPAVGAAVLMPDLGGLLAFAPLSAFLAVWGGVQLAILRRESHALPPPHPAAAAALAVWAFGLFALALDRYGASFLPSGPRLLPALMLLPGAWLTVHGDALLTRGIGWPWRIGARAMPLAALLGAMLLDPPLGVAFTVLPVTVLFWVVFGTAGRWVAARTGAGTPVPVLGVMLAWALAASTPVIAG